MNSEAHAHAPEWEVSAAPLLIVVGIFLALPLAFSAYFVYSNTLMTAILAGLGAPILIAGIAKWTSEGIHSKHGQYGFAEVGLPIFIISEIFLFLGLFAAYWTTRLQAASWPPEGTPDISYGLPVFMTVVLVSSSFTIHIAETKHEKNDLAGFKMWLMITIALGLLFVGCSVYEYNHLLHQGFGPGTNVYSGAFYGITGFHVAHVIVGISIFLAVLLPALNGHTNKSFIVCAAVYWHFVDIVWFFVVSEIYFW